MRAVSLLLLLVASPALAKAEEFKRLSGRAITARFTGSTFTDEVHWSYQFQRRGRLTSTALGRYREGTWWVAADRLCASNGPGSAECHEVWASRTTVQLRREDAPAEEGILVRSTAKPPT